MSVKFSGRCVRTVHPLTKR